MCLLFFALDAHPAHRLIVAANRDEYYQRPTQPLHRWPEDQRVLAGRDLQEGGTWFGVTTAGRWAAVTNYREPAAGAGPRSRGALVRDYLISGRPATAYMEDVARRSAQFGGFNLVVGSDDGAFYVSNRHPTIRRLQPGVYGLSNHLLDTPWPKVELGKKDLKQLMLQPAVDIDSLFNLMNNRDAAPDQELPDTGLDVEWERLLSSAFISGESYGTRSSTVVLINSADNRLKLEERTFESRPEQRPHVYSSVSYEFDIINSAA